MARAAVGLPQLYFAPTIADPGLAAGAMSCLPGACGGSMQSANMTLRHAVQIAMHITRGDTAAAIQAATVYLDTFQTDRIVWEQLHRLYLEREMRDQAAFCLEECLLHAPSDAATALKLANLLYQQGGAKVAAARGYYARVIELTRGENVQALEGLLACEDAAAAGATKSGKKGRNSRNDDEGAAGPTELGELAREQLAKVRAAQPADSEQSPAAPRLSSDAEVSSSGQ